MPSYIPRFNIIYYKNILDNVLAKFYQDFGGYFIKDEETQTYIFTKQFSKVKFKSILKSYIIDYIKTIVKPQVIGVRNYYIIVGSCFPCNNICLNWVNPSKLTDDIKFFIENKPEVKYYLTESDVVIDIDLLNSSLEDIYNEFFNHKKLIKAFGKQYNHILFIKYNNFDCYTLYKIIKYIYGDTITCNLYKKLPNKVDHVIHSLNEHIKMLVTKNIKEIIKTQEFECQRNEIKQFIDNLINTIKAEE